MATAPLLYNNTKILNNVYDETTNSLATSAGGTSINPPDVKLDQIYMSDIDWDESEFPNWVGNPQDLFGNIQNGGIYNDTTDNPKYFILKLIRTKTMRTFGVGTSIGFFKNIKATLLGSGDQERGYLDLSLEDSAQISIR